MKTQRKRYQKRSITGRPPIYPAFQMYAAARLADRNFKFMTLAERGLLHTLELEVWVNRTLPADPTALGRVLGLTLEEVEAALSGRVLRHFQAAKHDVEGDVLIHPELEDYRAKLEAHHRRMSEWGKRGAEARWPKTQFDSNGSVDSHPISHPNVQAIGQNMAGKYSTNQTSTNKTSSSLEKDVELQKHRDWINAFVKGDRPSTCPRCAGEGCRHCDGRERAKNRIESY